MKTLFKFTWHGYRLNRRGTEKSKLFQEVIEYSFVDLATTMNQLKPIQITSGKGMCHLNLFHSFFPSFRCFIYSIQFYMVNKFLLLSMKMHDFFSIPFY